MYQIKKDLEKLVEIQQRILTAEPENEQASRCLEIAYSGSHSSEVQARIINRR
ncbi:hypothetical protein H6G80_30680 [Nostoc sp. FACHB-87]|uniref:hypothetical protein n=1 Tax=Nostocaceae TaxID=1162 RepID=UPI00168A2196|nr:MULTISPECIES: hypothetical protein [Nostocaceae]MBD2458420.1 hypothetical protein [Nostoc sp. FACHB-87]MBD2479484.1 hypothetical protein [Anabaena sp. FACHB-83]